MTRTLCPSAEVMTGFLRDNFDGQNFPTVTHAQTGEISLSLNCTAEELRPGGFISGPTLMALADTAGLMGVFSHTGMTLAAFTTSLSIDFLHAAKGKTLLAEAKVARFGRTLCVTNVALRVEGMDKPCAQAVVTYATPKTV